MTDLRRIVGNRIRLVRKEQGLTQQELADRSGLDDAYIGGIERGERNFTIDTLDKVLNGLNIKPDELFSGMSLNFNQDSKRDALEELVSIAVTLNSDQIAALNRINREILKTMK
ncbi:transcriptional regulator [Bacillaceae bacterium JMAK1]|nr:transcriptional regulator [Bacillaceae bacterium JMAK1]